MNIHAGISPHEIVAFIEDCEKQSIAAGNAEFWCFLDEINTCESQGFISELFVDRRLRNRKLSPSLAFFAAANPFRLRSEPVGSGISAAPKRREYRHLVYSVHPIPEKLLQCVYDFGKLGEKEEKAYIEVMCQDLCAKLESRKMTFAIVDRFLHTGTYEAPVLQGARRIDLVADLVELICRSQNFIITHFPDCLVSLRDIKRYIEMVHFLIEFYNRRESVLIQLNRARATKKYHVYVWSPDMLLFHAVLFALMICYHARINTTDLRLDYVRLLQDVFCRGRSCLTTVFHASQYTFKNIERLKKFEARRHHEYEECLLSLWHSEMCDLVKPSLIMKIPPEVVLSNTLVENVYVVLICLLMREPVILVGKPGMSKSLALSILDNNLKGSASEMEFWRHWPKLDTVAYQGSDVSSSAGIVRRFERAQELHDKKALIGGTQGALACFFGILC